MPLEESARERAVKDLVGQARRALPVREANTPLSTVVQTEIAIHVLADAIERSVDSSIGQAPIAFVQNERLEVQEYGPEQLQALYDGITDRTGQSPRPGGRKFVISFPDIELSIGEIWPDGCEAPEDPTPEDVVEVMKASHGIGVRGVISEWLLIESLAVKYRGDEDGETAVEWDGS
jgi:hypothetical protein